MKPSDGSMDRAIRSPFLVRLLVAGWLAVTPAWAAIAGWSFTMRAENDLPVNSDRYYTNGVSFSFARCTDDSDALWPRVLRLPGLDRPGLLANGFDLGQVMVTPARDAAAWGREFDAQPRRAEFGAVAVTWFR